MDLVAVLTDVVQESMGVASFLALVYLGVWRMNRLEERLDQIRGAIETNTEAIRQRKHNEDNAANNGKPPTTRRNKWI